MVGGLWWAYFHRSAGLMEHYIERARVPFFTVRSILVYGHLALVAGLIALAVGFEHVLEDPRHLVPLDTTALLCCGAMAFLAMCSVIRLRSARKIYRSRVLACVVCLLLIPVRPHLSGVVLLGLPAAVTVAECAWETLAPASAGVPDRDELADMAAQA